MLFQFAFGTPEDLRLPNAFGQPVQIREENTPSNPCCVEFHKEFLFGWPRHIPLHEVVEIETVLVKSLLQTILQRLVWSRVVRESSTLSDYSDAVK